MSVAVIESLSPVEKAYPSKGAARTRVNRWGLPPVLPEDGIVDMVAVELTIVGRRVRLTKRERQAVVELMTGRGYSARAIAQRLGCDARSVCRRRSAARGRS